MNFIKYSGIFSVCLLAACATHNMAPGSPTNTPEAAHKPGELAPATTTEGTAATPATAKAKPATAATSWELSGAMAARNKNKGWTASLDWVQQGPGHYQIRLLGPLGGGTVVIEKSNGTVTYTDGPKKVTSASADKLLLQQTGISMPVQNLYYWIRGLPAPGAVSSSKYDANGHLISLNQAGYSIHYSDYMAVKNMALPGRVHLQGHNAVFKLIIKHWKV